MDHIFLCLLGCPFPVPLQRESDAPRLAPNCRVRTWGTGSLDEFEVGPRLSTPITQIKDVLQVTDREAGHATSVVIGLPASVSQVFVGPVRSVKVKLVKL